MLALILGCACSVLTPDYSPLTQEEQSAYTVEITNYVMEIMDERERTIWLRDNFSYFVHIENVKWEANHKFPNMSKD